MKNALLTFLFAVGMMAYSFGQYPDCTVYITNTSGSNLVVVVQMTTESPNICPGSFTITPEIFVPVGAVNFEIDLGTVTGPSDPAIRPYLIGSYNADATELPGSWQINQCWNPACIASDEPILDIEFVSCGDFENYVTIN